MKKLVLAGLLGLGSLVMAQTYYSALPYAGVINYSGDTAKDNGYVGGVYFSAFKSPYKVELDAEHTQIKYKDNTPTLNQSDFTGIFHYYQGYNLDYKLGIHYISSDDKLTDKAKIFTAGILYYKTLKYNTGIDLYYSDYSNLSTSPKLWQISPKAGINFGNYYSKIGSFYAEAKIDYIHPSKNKDENNLKSSYTSGEFSLSNYKGAFTTKLSGWIGKRVFAVDNGGFIVNNLTSEQKFGAKVSESYKIDKKSNIKIEYSYTKFDGDTSGNAHSNTYLASYNYNF
jgi:hypothetical protein